MNSFINWLKGLIRLFKKDDIKRAFSVTGVISDAMQKRLELWGDMYAGNAPWLSENIFSLRLEQAITREFSNITLGEMCLTISNEKLHSLVENAIVGINERFQAGLATGAMIIKPLGADKVQYVPQNSYIPVEFDSSGRLTKVIFPEVIKRGEVYYIRLEYHCLDEKGLTIQNKAYKSANKNSLGREIPLNTLSEWENLEETITYPLMRRPAFGYYRNPIDNTVDGSYCGVSIFDSATNLIKKTDTQFARLDWDYESGERAIHVDDTALQYDESKNGRVSKLNKRLYRGLSVDTGNAELFKDFSPQFREQSLIAGLEEYKRNIEFSVGLSYGDISNPQMVEKTATEIKSAKKRKYNTVGAIQKSLKGCLEDLVYAIAFYNGMATTSYSVICDFKDSVLTDEETERKLDKEDLSLGILSPAEYRAKWYGETLEEAEKNLPQQASVIE